MQANENKSCEYYETEAKGEKQKENQTIEIWNHEEKITNLIFYFAANINVSIPQICLINSC